MNRPTYYRTWCKTCNDWTVHYSKGEEMECGICSTEFSEILISKIPKEKVQEQRDRYKAQKSEDFRTMMSGMMSNLYMDSMTRTLMELFEEDKPPKLIESDAGQKNIDKRKRELESVEREKRAEIRRQHALEVLKFKSINRNDICLCGSNKKYKKCCWDKIEAYSNE